MNDYRRLTQREKNKLKIRRKIKKVARKSIFWWSVVVTVVLLFVVGIISFFKFVDKKYEPENCQTSQVKNSDSLSDVSDDSQGLDILKKNELDMELKNSGNTSSENLEPDNKKQSNTAKYDFSTWNKTCSLELIVVNSNNPIPESIEIKTKNCRGKEIASVACEALSEMISDAKKDGINLWISSGYRDLQLQTKLFNRQVEKEKSSKIISKEEAEKLAASVVARPGTSEHNTGLAVDFNDVRDDFYKTKEYKWLMDNAHKYGFIERYQKKWKDLTGVIYEPWHFRYVGKEHAPKIKESGICLEEYAAKNFIK